MVAPAI